MAQDLAAGILGNKNPCTNVLIDLAKWTGAPFGGPAPALATADRDHWRRYNGLQTMSRPIQPKAMD